MQLYPAIDLKEGHCVRLYKGDMAQATVFSDDPGAQAARFVAAGATWLHVVDLDGAFAGTSRNGEAVSRILQSVGGTPVQLGGGIRSLEAIAAWLERGVSRVILGTMAVRDPDLVIEACRAFPGRVAVGVDARDGRVAVSGWAEQSELSAVDLAARFADAGVAALIYTDIDRDGAMGGPNVEATRALAAATEIPVIASGGVSSVDDIAALRTAGGVAGVIVGRALYDGAVTVESALAACAGGDYGSC